MVVGNRLDLRCGVLFTGYTIPEWAQPFIKHLQSFCGPTNVRWLQLEKRNNGEPLIYTNAENTQQIESQLSVRSLSEFKALRLDFVVTITDETLPQAWMQTVAHGFWFYVFGSNELSGERFGFNEVWRREPTQEVTLERLLFQGGAREILKFGSFKTVPTSLRAHRAATIIQCSSWPANLAEEITRKGNISGQINEIMISPPSRADHFRQSLLAVVLSFRCLFRKVKWLLHKISRVFTYSEWNIGMVENFARLFPHQMRNAQANWLLEPKWPIFYADPFIGHYRGKPYLAAERYNYHDEKGAIALFPISDKALGQEETSLVFPFHSSYPCLVEDDEKLYCIPESLEREEIAVYRCHSFPSDWRKDAVVVSGKAFSDPTAFKHEGRWWLFATAYDRYSEGSSQLYAWYADSLTGPWTSHLKNPIKCDISGARSAGTPFQLNSIQYRPTQDCSRGYGKSIAIQRITKLTPEEFEEEYSSRLLPDPKYPDACHHFAIWGTSAVIDGRKDKFSIAAAFANSVRIKNYLWKRVAVVVKPPVPVTVPGLVHEMKIK